ARPLDEGDASVAAPSFRAAASLAATDARWAILTNGREWRLHSARAGIADFLSVDLHRVLETGDEEGFRVFRLCFGAASFAPGGTMDALPAEAAACGQELERRLKTIVLDDVFQRLARGFIDGRRRRGIVDAGDGALHEVEEAATRLLFRLLAAFHAEARGLLPVDDERYAAISLARLRTRVAELRDAGRPLSPTEHEVWNALLPLWDALARGDASLAVPRLGGALFGDEAGDRFLRENPVSDFFLVHALDHLSRDGERRFVDFAEVPIDHLGALRAALREHRLAVDEAGKPVLAGDRKAGAPAPPSSDAVVDYVVAQAIGPALEERADAFRAAAGDVAWRRDRLASASSEELEREEREIADLEDVAVDALLDLRVADPAMGSGRFLLRAADFIARRVAALAADLPANPLARRLSAARDELDARAPSIDRNDLGDAVLLARAVARRCVFGVDRDALSVDLARLSLQLAAHLPGAPPLFLDPHFKRGDALVGTRVAEVERALEEDPRGQFDAFSGPFRGLPRALEPARGLAGAPEGEAEARFADAEREAAPYRRLLDAWVSRAFGNRLGAELVGVHAPRVLEAARGMAGSFGAAHRDALAAAERLAGEHRFFHWDLEFPEAFEGDDPGFDAIVGAPPSARPEQAAALRPHLSSAFAEVHDGSADLSVYFFRQGTALLRRGGRLAYLAGTRWLRASHAEALRRWLAERAETEALVEL
ncbi:MAG TPA: hypothetical protein VFQ39_07815, partial [Longimicrobium sp.]|nr:hypothetical protein [Longimicrobium sp.]